MSVGDPISCKNERAHFCMTFCRLNHNLIYISSKSTRCCEPPRSPSGRSGCSCFCHRATVQAFLSGSFYCIFWFFFTAFPTYNLILFPTLCQVFFLLFCKEFQIRRLSLYPDNLFLYYTTCILGCKTQYCTIFHVCFCASCGIEQSF